MANDEFTPPRMFNVVTSKGVNSDLDTVEYLMKQEIMRRQNARQPNMTEWELGEFRRQLINTLIIHADAVGAINLRPTTQRVMLNEQK